MSSLTKFGKFVATHKWFWLLLKHTAVPVSFLWAFLREAIRQFGPEYRDAVATAESAMKDYRDSLVVPATPGAPSGGHVGVNPPKQAK